MRHLTKWRGEALALGIGLLSGALLLPPGVAMAERAIQEVFVTNTPDRPVPTAAQGTTNVAGTVEVSNSPTVQVGNPDTAPVPVREVGAPARRPFQRQMLLCFGPGQNRGFSEVFTVPAGTRVAIEHVAFGVGGVERNLFFTFRGDDPPAAALLVFEPGTQLPDADYYWALDVERQDYNETGVHAYVINQELLAYAEAGQRLRVEFRTNIGNDTSSTDCAGTVMLTGYEEDT